MNSILKKTLIAAAVASVATANASTITSLSSNSSYTGAAYPLVSLEGIGTQANQLTIGTDVNLTVTTQAAYVENDRLEITISGATINEDDSTVAYTGTSGFTLLNVDSETGTISFRVTDSAGVASGATVTLTGVVLDVDGATTIAAAANGVISGSTDEFDDSDSTTIATVASEFTITNGTDSLDETIDVDASRQQFVDNATTDAFDLTVSGGADVFAAGTEEVVVTLVGSDLTFLNDADGDLDSGSYALTTSSTGEAAAELSEDGTTFTVTSSGNVAAGTDAITLELTVDGEGDDAAVLEDQSFTADVSMTYDIGGTEDTFEVTGLDVGEWDLSGRSFNLPYLPYGSGITQIVYLSNDGSVNGDIELTAFDDEGNTFGPVTISQTATANATVNLSSAIYSALEDEGYDGGSAKMDITLTVNSPCENLDLFAAYNVRGDRLSVPVVGDECETD